MSIFSSDIKTKFKTTPPKIWSDRDIIIKPVQNNMPSDVNAKIHEQKQKLNNTRLKMNEYKNTPYDFESLFRNFDFYGNLYNFYENRFGAQVVTNNWLKAYEMIHTYELVGKTKTEMNIFFNAELPGSFISAANHYCKTHTVKMNWLASSYFPSGSKDQSIVGDKYRIYANYPENWIMSRSMNGDLTVPANLTQIKKKVKGTFDNGVDLYFSDGSIDVDADENREEINALLNFGQLLSGLMVLKPGGNFVVKQTTLFSALNISFTTLLSNMFREFYIVKPTVSIPIDNEVYFIGKHFIGLIPSLEEKLLTIMKELIDIGPRLCADYSFYENSNRIRDVLEMLISYSNTIFIEGDVPFLNEALSVIKTTDLSDIFEKIGKFYLEKQNKYISKFKIIRLHSQDELNIQKNHNLFTTEIRKDAIVVNPQIANQSYFGKVFTRDASDRLYYTFMSIFNKPFQLRDQYQLDISKQIFARLSADIAAGENDKVIYDNLHRNMNELYYSFYKAPEIFTAGRANSRVDDIVKILDKVSRLPKIETYIDFGCGECSISSAIGKAIKASNIVGMDITVPKRAVDFTFTKLNPDDSRIPDHADNTVDFITCLMVLHHLRRPEETIKEFSRILKPGGILLIREHDIDGDVDIDGKVFIDIQHGFYEVVWAKLGEQENPNHVSEYFANYKNREKWTKMITTNGFRRLNENKLDENYTSAVVPREYGPGKKIINPFYHYYAVYVKE